MTGATSGARTAFWRTWVHLQLLVGFMLLNL